jgi:ribonuclease BN (tRNA processing enzyme)
MKLTFLGIGSAFNPEMENTGAFFVQGDELYLLDCGETSFGRIWNSRALKNCSGVTVAVTHLHCDHAGSLGSLISYCAMVLKKSVRVIHPLETVRDLLDLMGIERSFYTWLPFLVIEQWPGVSFQPVEIEHVDNMRCFGYIIYDSEKKIYYSGDAKFIPPCIIDAFRKGELDEIYQDSSLLTGDHAAHGSFKYLQETFAPEFRGRVYCIHLDSDYRETILAAGFGVPELMS